MAARRIFHANDAAAFLHARSGIQENDRLARDDLHVQLHKAAMSVDDEGVSFFAKLLAVGQNCYHNDWDLQHNPFAAAPILGRSRWVRHVRAFRPPLE